MGSWDRWKGGRKLGPVSQRTGHLISTLIREQALTGGSEGRIFYQRRVISMCQLSRHDMHICTHSYMASIFGTALYTHLHPLNRFLWAQPQESSPARRTTGHTSQDGRIETHVSVKYNLNHMLLPDFCLVHQNMSFTCEFGEPEAFQNFFFF